MRERACRAVRAEQRDAHRLGGAFLDGVTAFTLIPVGSNSIAKASVIALSAVFDAA